MTPPRIRALALCVFHYQGRILVNRFDDPVTGRCMYRPLGGGIEFGETSAQAIVREIHEELDLPIDHLRLLGTLESLFVYNDKPGHEIVMVYDGQFTDPTRYEQPHLDGHESNGAPFRATWQGSASFTDESPLVPLGLQALLKDTGLLD
ncbi:MULTISPECIES: NUDIX hydrolase [Pseudomonas]|uniref:NUDIX hydrolase n=1 Tax=Pseudomonas TaxID=286 RepID=UPI000CFF1B05|nr:MULTISPECIES: NUDIX hydrolase [Pseudomonas]PRA47429.1 NUDIX hydrolase [Pseudomonas sp. MYb115]QXN47846.1 NUDIX hydrolase [Pseudomonas fluorescens]WSO22153.1 NUDIX hydrolase [Pseudomonas fluorescens]